MKRIQDADVRGKNVLVRIDADVPIKDGIILDDERLRASIPTLQMILERGAKLVTIMGHLGKPNGQENPEFSLTSIDAKLNELLGTHERWQILENLRFSPGEEKNDPAFFKALAQGYDLFVQDAFATCHRSHASTVGLPTVLPSYAGLALQSEIENLSKILQISDADFTVIIGGKKAEDKLPVIENLISKAKNFLIGGVVANTFLACLNYDLGKSLVEKDVFEKTREILTLFEKNPSKNLYLPKDLVMSKSFERPVDPVIVKIEDLKSINYAEFIAVDIGEKTVNDYRRILYESKTIFWNGNLGITEVLDFSHGSRAILEAIVDNSSASKYAGGGDTSVFIRQNNLQKSFNFISNAGGAALEFLAGKSLPGIEALK